MLRLQSDTDESGVFVLTGLQGTRAGGARPIPFSGLPETWVAGGAECFFQWKKSSGTAKILQVRTVGHWHSRIKRFIYILSLVSHY